MLCACNGWLAIFDGGYATATVARHPADPLQCCVQALFDCIRARSWLMRRLPGLVEPSGFNGASMESHGYVESPRAGYMLAWIERGADVLIGGGCIDSRAADAVLSASHQPLCTGQVWRRAGRRDTRRSAALRRAPTRA